MSQRQSKRVLYSITEDTAKGMQFGAGLILKNFDYHDIETMTKFKEAIDEAVKEGKALGATDGGVNANIAVTYGRPSVDGLSMFPFKGLELPESLECYIETTIKEFSPDKLQSVYGTSRFAYGGEEALSQRINTTIADEDYYDNITWIATTNYGYIMLSVFNVLGKAGGAIAAVQGVAAGGIPFRADGNLESFADTEFVPAEIKYFYTSKTELETVIDRIDVHRVTLPDNPNG